MKRILIAIAVLVGLAALGYAILYARHRLQVHRDLYSRPRKEWKDAAIATVTRLAEDSRWVTN